MIRNVNNDVTMNPPVPIESTSHIMHMDGRLLFRFFPIVINRVKTFEVIMFFGKRDNIKSLE